MVQGEQLIGPQASNAFGVIDRPGTLYALSTFGSIVGTLGTSFYLITLAGINALIMGQGALLVVLAIPLYFMKLSCSIGDVSGPADSGLGKSGHQNAL